MPNYIDLTTNASPTYRFFPTTSGYVRFNVKAANQAHVVLTTAPQNSAPSYEVIIGDEDNSSTIIKKDGKVCKKELTPNILDKENLKSFTIRWDYGTINVSQTQDQKSDTIITWDDPHPFSVIYAGFSRTLGTTSVWKLEDGNEFKFTSVINKRNFQFFPIKNGMQEVMFHGPHNCHICLSSGPSNSNPIYEIIIGGWENTKSVIRYNGKDMISEVKTLNILNPKKFRNFLIQWSEGLLSVRDGDTENGVEIMRLENGESFGITHFGVRIGEYGETAEWKIKHF